MTKFQIIRDILALDDLTAQQKLVLIAMNQYGDEGRNVYPATGTIAKMVSLARRQVKRHMAALRDKGYLIATGKSKRNTINYRMAIPNQGGVAKVTKGVSSRTPSECHPRPPTTLDDKPYKYPPRVEQSTGAYFDSDSDYEGPKLDQYGRNTETVHEQSVRLNRARRQQT